MHVGLSRYYHSHQSHEKVEADTSTGTCSWTANSIRKADSQYLCTKEAYVIDHKGGKSSLVDNIFPTVNRSSTSDFTPNNKNKSYVVDPSVDTIEQIVAKLGAVR